MREINFFKLETLQGKKRVCIPVICNLLRPTETHDLDTDKLTNWNKTAHIHCGSLKIVFYLFAEQIVQCEFALVD